MKARYFFFIAISVVSLVWMPQARAQSQHTFSFLLDYSTRKFTSQAIEDGQGNIITLVTNITGQAHTPFEYINSYLLIFTPEGDTSTVRFHFGDTVFNFAAITRMYDSTYIVAGFSRLPAPNKLFLMLMHLNQNKEILWVKHHPLKGYKFGGITKLFSLGNDLILGGNICDLPQCGRRFFYMIRFTPNGTVKYEYVHNTPFPGKVDYLLNKNSSRLWVFTCTGDQTKRVFDTSFNYLYSVPMPSIIWRLYNSAAWNSDTTFLLSYMCTPTSAPSLDDELCVGIFDSTMNAYFSNNFGALDTIDYPATKHSADFKHPDTIYIAGTKNMSIWLPPPGFGSWIMTGQLNSTLQPRYINFIGGDAFYLTEYILATSDGGKFIGASKYNHATQIFDLLFLKLNSEGILVGASEPGLRQMKSLLYPNPARGRVTLETYLSETNILIHDLKGRLVREQVGSERKTYVNIENLPAGIYLLSLYSKGQFVEYHKLIVN